MATAAIICSLVVLTARNADATTHDTDASKYLREAEARTERAQDSIIQTIADIWDASAWLAVIVAGFTLLFYAGRAVLGMPITGQVMRLFAALLLIQVSWTVVGMLATIGQAKYTSGDNKTAVWRKATAEGPCERGQYEVENTVGQIKCTDTVPDE